VRERAGIEDDAGEALAPRGLEPVDELALVIGLAALDRVTAAARVIAEHPVDLRERRAAVHAGLAGAEEIEIRPVQHEDLHRETELSISGRRAETRASRGVEAPSVS